MKDIARVATRETLPPRKAPYWLKLGAGRHLGFRRLTPASVGSWVAKYRDAATGKESTHALGDFVEVPAHQRFDLAKAAAEEWFKHLGLGGSTTSVTVKTACALYVKHLRREKREKTADDAEGRFRRWVDDNDIGRVELGKLTRPQVKAWRQALAAAVVQVNYDDENPVTRERSASSVNRDAGALRAALNFAHDEGYVTTDEAWRVALRPTKGADGRREVYLDKVQRRALVDAAPADLALLVKALSLVPLRPGAMAALQAKHFDRRLGVLTIGQDKAGQDRRIKLPKSTAAFFAELAKDKLPGAPLLARADGKAWDRHSWKGPLKEAAAAAKLPEDTVLYSLRHAAITDLARDGCDLLTVATLAGTSIEMIQKHYGHMAGEHAAAALEGLAL
jgi:integrase